MNKILSRELKVNIFDNESVQKHFPILNIKQNKQYLSKAF